MVVHSRVVDHTLIASKVGSLVDPDDLTGVQLCVAHSGDRCRGLWGLVIFAQTPNIFEKKYYSAIYSRLLCSSPSWQKERVSLIYSLQ